MCLKQQHTWKMDAAGEFKEWKRSHKAVGGEEKSVDKEGEFHNDGLERWALHNGQQHPLPLGSNKALALPGVNVNMSTSCGKQHPVTVCSLCLLESQCILGQIITFICQMTSKSRNWNIKPSRVTSQLPTSGQKHTSECAVSKTCAPAPCYCVTTGPADPTSAQTPVCLWVQKPRGWFCSSLWKRAVAGCCPLRRYGGSYGQQICPHTLTRIHHLSTHEQKHCGDHAEREPEQRDNSSHYGLI